MKKNRLIFYAVFAAFHLFTVFFTIFVDSNKNDLSFLSKIHGWISLMKYGAMVGLLLLIIDVIWDFASLRDLNKENSALNQEIGALKAKLFDLQEAAKSSPAPGTTGASPRV